MTGTRHHSPGATARAGEVGLVALVCGGVLLFGGAHPATRAGMALVACGLLAAGLVVAAVRGRLRVALSPLTVAAGIVLATMAARPWLGLTLSPEATREALLHYGTATIVLLLASTFARSTRDVARLALPLAMLAAFETLYGIAEHYSGHEWILAWPKLYPGNVTGTYVNRDHFASLLALLTPLTLALALRQPAHWHPGLPNVRTRLAYATRSGSFWKRTLLLATAALTTLGIALSQSRGALLALTAALATFALLEIRRRRRDPKSRGRTTVVAVLAVLAIAALGLATYGAQPLIRRFQSLPDQAATHPASRLTFARDTLRMIADHPLAGVGPGAFETAYPAYQQTWVHNMRLDHAHNDYLETAAEEGFFGGLLVVGILGVGRWILGRRRKRKRKGRRGGATDPAGDPLESGLAAALVAIASHALVDFNLQLTGSLAVAAYVTGLFVGPRSPRLHLRGRTARLAATTALALLVASPAAPYALRVLRAERLAHPTLHRRDRDDPRPPPEQLEALEKAIALRPEQTRYRLRAASLRQRILADDLHRATADTARNLWQRLHPDAPQDVPPPARLLDAVRPAVRLAHAKTIRAVYERNRQDLRAARQAEPQNPYVLAELARWSPGRKEAWRTSAAAARAYPEGAPTLAKAALARLRFDPEDPEARSWLARALALDVALVSRVAPRALDLHARAALEAALPDTPFAHHALAQALLPRVSKEDLARELDHLAKLEERAAKPDQAASTRPSKTPPDAKHRPAETDTQPHPARRHPTIRAGDWLRRPGGRPLVPLGALALPLPRGQRAFAYASASGALELELSTLPEDPPVVLCVRYQGHHIGHLVVTDGWKTHTLPLRNPGWVELAYATDVHHLDPPHHPRSATALVRTSHLRGH